MLFHGSSYLSSMSSNMHLVSLECLKSLVVPSSCVPRGELHSRHTQVRRLWWTDEQTRVLGFAFANLIVAASFWLIGTLGGPLQSLSLLYALAVLVPNVAITARRLHDTGRSGWWLPLGIIPTPLVLIILFFVCQRGQVESNRYGPASER